LTDEMLNGPVRTCVGCGNRDERPRMIRLRADGSGELCLAARRAVAGRTAYLHVREDCIRAIARSKRLFRSLRTHVEASARERFVALALDLLSRERTTTRASTVG
jgi:predicted RNA-binding protein YlxR (DUF448 family)